MTKPLVHVIGTGGSISAIGRSRTDFLDYSHADRHFSIEEMLARVPEVNDLATIRSEQFINVGSGEVAPEHWLDLARLVNARLRETQDIAGIAITHGTATLEDTAYFLNLTVKTSKPVVVTGAMRPMTAMSNDADVNLLDCVRVAGSRNAGGRGVLVVLNNQIQAARDVTKTSTSRLDTFKSADLGYLGYADSDGEVVFFREPTRLHTQRSEFDVEQVKKLPRVDIALAYAGVDDTAVNALANAGCEGLVAAGLGSGNASKLFMDALAKVAKQGVPVIAASQVGTGRVMGRRAFLDRGLIPAGTLAPRKARILLMLALTRTRDPAEIVRMFETY